MTKSNDTLVAIAAALLDGEQDTAGNQIWVDCIPGWSDERKFPGTMASLSQKGLVRTDGECVSLTQAGVDAVKGSPK